MAHADANIIFGAVIDDEMGDEVRVTVIAAGFDRWETGGRGGEDVSTRRGADIFGDEEPEPEDDDFDVPSFLR